jgi:hypothetical protein
MQALRKVQGQTKADLEDARRHITLATRHLQQVRETAAAAEANPIGFNPEANRQLMAPIPPRPIRANLALRLPLSYNL